MGSETLHTRLGPQQILRKEKTPLVVVPNKLYLCRYSAWEVPWVALARTAWPPQLESALPLHPVPPPLHWLRGAAGAYDMFLTVSGIPTLSHAYLRRFPFCLDRCGYRLFPSFRSGAPETYIAM